MSQNSNFCEEFMVCIKAIITEVESSLGRNSEEVDNRLKLVGLFALIALHNRLFQALDKKLLNKIWDLCKKVIFSICLHLLLAIYKLKLSHQVHLKTFFFNFSFYHGYSIKLSAFIT